MNACSIVNFPRGQDLEQHTRWSCKKQRVNENACIKMFVFICLKCKYPHWDYWHSEWLQPPSPQSSSSSHSCRVRNRGSIADEPISDNIRLKEDDPEEAGGRIFRRIAPNSKRQIKVETRGKEAALLCFYLCAFASSVHPRISFPTPEKDFL